MEIPAAHFSLLTGDDDNDDDGDECKTDAFPIYTIHMKIHHMTSHRSIPTTNFALGEHKGQF